MSKPIELHESVIPEKYRNEALNVIGAAIRRMMKDGLSAIMKDAYATDIMFGHRSPLPPASSEDYSADFATMLEPVMDRLREAIGVELAEMMATSSNQYRDPMECMAIAAYAENIISINENPPTVYVQRSVNPRLDPDHPDQKLNIIRITPADPTTTGAIEDIGVIEKVQPADRYEVGRTMPEPCPRGYTAEPSGETTPYNPSFPDGQSK